MQGYCEDELEGLPTCDQVTDDIKRALGSKWLASLFGDIIGPDNNVNIALAETCCRELRSGGDDFNYRPENLVSLAQASQDEKYQPDSLEKFASEPLTKPSFLNYLYESFHYKWGWRLIASLLSVLPAVLVCMVYQPPQVAICLLLD